MQRPDDGRWLSAGINHDKRQRLLRMLEQTSTARTNSPDLPEQPDLDRHRSTSRYPNAERQAKLGETRWNFTFQMQKGQLIAGLYCRVQIPRFPQVFLLTLAKNSNFLNLNAKFWWAVQVSNLMFRQQ